MDQAVVRDEPTSSSRSWALGMVVLTVAVGALVVYKATGSLAALSKANASGAVAPKASVLDPETFPVALRALAGTLNYFSWVVVALAFGIVIGALTRAVVPAVWMSRALGGTGVRQQVIGALVGAPLMLCSCCAAPVFEGIYERTRRAGPALAAMLSAPGLNPAALALTFLLFPAGIAWTRLTASLLLVVLGTAWLARLTGAAAPADAACAIEAPANPRALAGAFWIALRDIARRSLPAIVVGVLLSAVLLELGPIDALASRREGAAAWLVIAAAALVATPIALPTFAEIPIAMLLMQSGAPGGAVVAVLIAGPIVNLPSLLTVGRLVSWRVAATTGLAVVGAATLAGIALELA